MRSSSNSKNSVGKGKRKQRKKNTQEASYWALVWHSIQITQAPLVHICQTCILGPHRCGSWGSEPVRYAVTFDNWAVMSHSCVENEPASISYPQRIPQVEGGRGVRTESFPQC